MSIVCATRFSEESQHAVAAAAALAKKVGDELCLVHVLPSGLLQSTSKDLEQTAKTALEDEVLRLQKSGLRVSGEVLSGKLGDALARYCERKDARLLIVGDTAKKTPVLLAGSLDKLAYAVEAPLLVVRDVAPLEAWSEARPLKVMLAFDRTASSAVARDWASRLADFGPVELVATQLYWPNEEYEERQLKPDEGHRGLAALITQELQAEFSNLPANVKVTLRPEMGTGNIANQLLAIAGEAQVDLVLLGTHRKRALGRLFSVSRTILVQAPMAVICVPQSTTVPHLAKAPAWKVGLVTTNFSEAGSRAIAWAASLLRNSGGGARLHVVHVSETPFDAGKEVAIVKRLSASLPADLEGSGVEVVFHVRHGDDVEVLRALTLQVDADVLIIGAELVPDFEEADQGVIAPQINRQWGLVQTLLETTHRPVLLTPPMKA